MNRRIEERPTVPMKRRPALVLVGTDPHGREMYRPLTPGAERMLASMAPVNRKPPAPIRPGAHRRAWPTWFLVGVLALLGLLLAGLAWVVITVLTAIAAAAGWLAGHLAVIIGTAVVLIVVAGLVFGRSIVINQSNSVRM